MNQEQDPGPAVLSVTAFAALVIAYLLGLTVLTDTGMASKFENAVAPAGTDISGLRTAAGASIVAVVCAWASAIASRRIIPFLLVLLASVPLVPLSLVTLQLAF